MKEGFFKKLAIGVAVSLVSTAVIAGVSGLFSGVGSGGNNDVCKHETRTTDGEIAPTCILGGVSGMVRCLDCGEIVVEGEELPPTGHTGELGETCTVCNEPIYGQYQNPNIYTLQDVGSDEIVIGDWYRIYVSQKQVDIFGSEVFGSIVIGSGISFIIRYAGDGNSQVYGENAYTFTDLGAVFPVVYGEDSYDTYVDFYFKEGGIIDDSHPDTDENGDTFFNEEKYVIDKDAKILSDWTVKRLVFGE